MKTIGLVAPSRPVYTIETVVNQGVEILKNQGYQVVLGKHFYDHLYYSAGQPEDRAADINEMFADSGIDAIVSATGGITSNQLLPYLDYELIKANRKPFVGYSDITTLLLAFWEKCGMHGVYGPDLCSLSSIDEESKKAFFQVIEDGRYEFPTQQLSVIRPGTGQGILLGGHLSTCNALFGIEFAPSYKNAVWFWESSGAAPAKVDSMLHQFRLTGAMDSLQGMVIGNLADYDDLKYPQDNRPIRDIVLEATEGLNFPIIQLPVFGHDLTHFLPLPIGNRVSIDTKKQEFKIHVR